MKQLEKKLRPRHKATYNRRLTPFENIANHLIYLTHRKIPLKPETILTISRIIQRDWIKALKKKHCRLQDKRIHQILRNINHTKANSRREKGRSKFKVGFLEQNSHITDPIQQLKLLMCSIQLDNMIERTNLYSKCGFTPKLAFEAKNELGGANCFGTNLHFGALCRNEGFEVNMGITADHPVLFITITGKRYIIDMVNIENKIELSLAPGEFVDMGHYSLYYSPQGVTKLMFVHNFDKAVIYETLENLEALKQVALGNYEVILPGYEEDTKKLAQQYANLLIPGDWRVLQRSLFPEISRSFDIHHEQWVEEFNRVRQERKNLSNRVRAMQKFCDIIEKAKVQSGWEELKLDSIYKEFLSGYERDIALTFAGQQPIPRDIQGQARSFLVSIKADLEKEKNVDIKKMIIKDLKLNLCGEAIIISHIDTLS